MKTWVSKKPEKQNFPSEIRLNKCDAIRLNKAKKLIKKLGGTSNESLS